MTGYMCSVTHAADKQILKMSFKFPKAVLLWLVLLIVLMSVYFLEQRHHSEARTSQPSYRHRDRTKLLVSLARVSSLPPPVPINHSCKPPPLPEIPSCREDTGLSGERLEQPRKLGLMILFAFEADTLEIALYDALDLVDFVFIVEATKTHKGVGTLMPGVLSNQMFLQAPKLLMWERLKYQERFKFVNKSKIVHVVVDDVIDSEKAKEDMW